MSFGYLIVVSQKENVNYLRLAYALALSIKNTQKNGYNSVALVVDDKKILKNIKHPEIFDHVIEWGEQTFWDGRSYMDQLTPFEHTVCLDADMLFLRDYSHWVEYFIQNCDLYIANQAFTYRGEIITGTYYRETFARNELPNLYSFYTFFKKGSKIVDEFFKLNRIILHNKKEFSNLFLTKFKPSVFGTDEIFSLTAKILDIENTISYDLEFPKVVHLKPMVQGWKFPAQSWDNHVGFYLDEQSKLKIGNYQQTDILHYVIKDKITEEHIEILEDLVCKTL